MLMPVWLIEILIRLLPVLLSAARKSGMINLVEEELIKFGMSLKTYHEPEDFPLAPPGKTNESNINRG